MDVLQLSQRRIADLVANCQGYEFEDIVSAVTNARMILSENTTQTELSRRIYKLARICSGSKRVAQLVVPSPQAMVQPGRNVDLFFPAFNHVYELYALAAIPNWRKQCRRAVCFITEVWPDMLPRYLLELLADFDHLFIGHTHSVEAVSRITGRPCSYLPLGVDVLRFAPVTMDQPRPIEVTYIGRRSRVTHQALLDESDLQQFFYYYDTVAASGASGQSRTFRVYNPNEHRFLLASLLSRTRFFVANRSVVSSQKLAAGRDEISTRFYEGAASGAIIVGDPPKNPAFREQFHWNDAVIDVPFDSPDIARILRDLQSNAPRQHAARRNNVREAALHFDWLYRVQHVFDVIGLAYTDEMHARGQRLRQVAARAIA